MKIEEPIVWSVGRSPMKEAVACLHSCLSVYCLKKRRSLMSTPSPLVSSGGFSPSPGGVGHRSMDPLVMKARESFPCWDTYQGRWVLNGYFLPTSPLLLGLAKHAVRTRCMVVCRHSLQNLPSSYDYFYSLHKI